MALSLITPQPSDFLRDFPGQNQVNCQNIDSFVGPALRSNSLQTFTPDLTSTTTKPTLGVGGYSRGFYYQVFDQIYMFGDFRFGTSGINAGAGTYILSLPFTINNLIGVSSGVGSSPVIGNASLFDDSAVSGSLPLTVHLRTTNQFHFGVKTNSGLAARELQATGYITWAVNDGVSWSAKFQRVPT